MKRRTVIKAGAVVGAAFVLPQQKKKLQPEIAVSEGWAPMLPIDFERMKKDRGQHLLDCGPEIAKLTSLRRTLSLKGDKQVVEIRARKHSRFTILWPKARPIHFIKTTVKIEWV